MKNLRLKITILIIFAVLVVAGVLSFVSYSRARESMSVQLENNYKDIADKYAHEITAWINTNASIVDSLAAYITISEIYDQGDEVFHRYLEESFEFLNKGEYIYDIYFTYPDNRMTCASDFVPDGTVDFAHDREWYLNAAKSNDICYSTSYKDYDSGYSIITISKGVYRDGVLQGVIAADIFVDILEKIINEADVAPNSYAFLIDQNMKMLVHPYEAYSYDDAPYGVMDIPNAPYEEVLKSINRGSFETVYLTDYDGITRGVIVSKLANTGWYVGIATSKEELMKGVSNLIGGFVIAMIIAVLIGSIMAIFLGKILDKLSKQQQEYEAQVLKLEKQVADEASRAKSQFLADMSHEIRTPINAILGMNEMIMRETNENTVLDYAKNIKNSSRNLLQLINSILDFSKIEDGKMELVPVRYSVSVLVSYLVNSVKERAESNNLEFNVNVDPNIPKELFGDDVRIDQIIVNLLTNAVKYTSRGSVTLTISEKERVEDRILLFVSVKDTGMGIKKSDMERLFEPFERVDVERNRNIEGTGLGISIVIKLLKLMDSELKVESEYGQGSEFSFELWQKIENPEPIGDYTKLTGEASKIHSYREAFKAPDARILLVDDTRMNILVAMNLLKKTGIKIDTSSNGAEAVRLSKENKYDVIFLDQRMPGMDGTETLKYIRTTFNSKNMETPIICLTADAIHGAKERYMAEGFTDYLTKPVEGSELERILIEYLPVEKIQTKLEEKTPEDEFDGTEDPGVTSLRKFGFDISSAMIYCQNDISLYRVMLTEFKNDYQTKRGNLQMFKEKKAWNDYMILIHSLKSSSKMIGAQSLSEKAALLEKASKENDETTIELEHDNTMEMYDKVVSAIASSTLCKLEDDEILEFYPQ